MPPSASSSTLPVSISAQVEAFTRLEADLPKWRPQSDGAILSSINASIVSASGTRSSASARHISAMPSSVGDFCAGRGIQRRSRYQLADKGRLIRQGGSFDAGPGGGCGHGEPSLFRSAYTEKDRLFS